MSYFNFFRAHDQFMPQHFRFRSGGFMMPRGGNVSITENININRFKYNVKFCGKCFEKVIDL